MCYLINFFFLSISFTSFIGDNGYFYPTIEQKLTQKSSHLEKAILLIQKQKINELLTHLEKPEVEKDPQVQTFVGYLFHDGVIFKQNYFQAARWWEKAALQGDPKAQSELADLYFHGQGVDKD